MTETASADATTPPGTRRAVLRVLARDALVLAALGVAAEVALQIVDPRYGEHLYDADFTGGKPVAVNAQGLRGQAVPTEKAADEFRVLALGDSTTFGTGVAAEETWPAQLARTLGTRGYRATWMNAASAAASVRQLTWDVEHKWAAYRPDVVVLATSGNLVSLAWIRRNDTVAAAAERTIAPAPSDLQRWKNDFNRHVKKLCLPSFLSLNVERGLYQVGLLEHNIRPAEPYGAMLAHGWRQIGLDKQLAANAWRIFEDDLEALRQAVSRAGARLVVTGLPSRFTLTDSWWDNEKAVPRQRLELMPPDLVGAICGRHGIAYVDAVGALRARRGEDGSEPLYLQCDYTHLDPAGHEVVAAALAGTVDTRRR